MHWCCLASADYQSRCHDKQGGLNTDEALEKTKGYFFLDVINSQIVGFLLKTEKRSLWQGEH